MTPICADPLSTSKLFEISRTQFFIMLKLAAPTEEDPSRRNMRSKFLLETAGQTENSLSTNVFEDLVLVVLL